MKESRSGIWWATLSLLLPISRLKRRWLENTAVRTFLALVSAGMP
jgi:hypothetical protein